MFNYASKYHFVIFIVYSDLQDTKKVLIANHLQDQFTHYNMPRQHCQDITDEDKNIIC